MPRVLVIDPSDNVATALEPVAVGSKLPVFTQTGECEITVIDPIPFGHKVALIDLLAGEPIKKYGVTIGLASQNVMSGAHVHVHNLESCRGRGDRT